MIQKLPSGYNTGTITYDASVAICENEYERGYERAVRDVQNTFNYVLNDFYYGDVYLTSSKIEGLLHCCRKNWDKLMKSMSGKSDGVFKWNKDKKEFEFVERIDKKI